MQARIYLILIFACFSNNIAAQNDTIWHQNPILNISGLLDVFYVYDFNHPLGTERQPFLFNHNRHNELNLNLGFLKLGVEHAKYRANLALQTGTYANDNYSSEPGLLKNFFEANVGVSLNSKNSLWIDAGIFASHIGFESAIAFDNWTLTRSLLAENSPYFLSGVKLAYNPSSKWKISGLIVNGWQRIQRLEGNSLPSLGTQLNFSPSQKVTFNWSTFIGTDDPDTIRRMRYFHNFYGLFQLAENFGLIAGFDIGTQQKSRGSSAYNFWYSPVIIGQYTINKTWKTALRAEYYQDETGIIIETGTPHGFKTTGLALNVDYRPADNLIWRFEGRWLKSRDKIFVTPSALADNNLILSTSISIRFSETLNHRKL